MVWQKHFGFLLAFGMHHWGQNVLGSDESKIAGHAAFAILLLRQIGMDTPCLDQSAGVVLKIKMELYFTYLPRWVNMATNKNMFTPLLPQVGHFGFYGIVKEQANNSSCLVCWYQTTDGVAYHAIKGCNVVYVTRSDIATCNG